MKEYFHSVRLITNRCKGCVNCTKRCPTEAIRIRSGKAQITQHRCIDCGECIRRCSNHAKTAITDTLEDLKNFAINIALPAPSLYGQFSQDISIAAIRAGLQKIGFDEAFDVAIGADIVTQTIKHYVEISKIKPLISSACPAVIRLIQVKYPELIDHIIPVLPPVEVAAQLAKNLAKQSWPDKNIGVWFITPCPAKVTTVKQPLGLVKSSINGSIGISSIYGELLSAVAKKATGDDGNVSATGIAWAIAGGEAAATQINNLLIVQEIHNVSDILEQVVLGKLKDVDYIECLACAGGCIGGPLTVENRFVAEQRINLRKKSLNSASGEFLREKFAGQFLETSMNPNDILPTPIMCMDEDISKAMFKVELMEEVLKKLPGLDCGSCGSPNCKALAEDVVLGKASETDCVFKLRERVRDLAEEMVDLAQKLPPPLDKDR